MIIRYLPLLGAFNVSVMYLMLVGGLLGTVVLFAVTKAVGNYVFVSDKGD